MRTLKRNKITIYLAKRDTTFDGDYQKFITPISVDVNFSAASSEVDIQTFGENYVNIRRSNVGLDLEDVFSESDRVYLEEPETFSVLANDADYVVKNVLDSINGYIVIYEKMSGDNA